MKKRLLKKLAKQAAKQGAWPVENLIAYMRECETYNLRGRRDALNRMYAYMRSQMDYYYSRYYG